MRPFRISKAGARRLPALGAAVFLALGLFAPQSQAASAGATARAGADTRGTAAPAPRSIPVPKSPHARDNASRFRISSQDGPEETAPAPAPTAKPLRADRAEKAEKGDKQSSAAAGDECGDLSGVINATGSALVRQLTALPRIT
ncbi:hypothetical protein ACFXA3_41925, partial [Streptomyces sp. NPDC059456]